MIVSKVVFLNLQGNFGSAQKWIARLLLFAALLLTGSRGLAAPKFTTTIEPQTISVGGSATLSLLFEGGSPDGAPRIPTMAGLTFQSAGQSSQTTIVNGQVSSSVNFQYIVTAAQPGDYTIPPMSVQVGGGRVVSQPLKLKVEKSLASTPGSGNEPAFVKLVLSKNELYVGEVLPVEVRLYFKEAVNINLPQLEGAGFNIGALPTNPERSSSVINNARYQLLIFRTVISPVKSGTVALGPARCNLSYPLNYRGVNVFGERVAGEVKQEVFSSDAQTVQVHPLPPNAPPTFKGAIGKYNLHVEAGPTSVGVGDPITVKVQISGHGALDSLSLPDQPAWREFKSYPATSRVQASGPLGLDGAKFFEQVVTPQNAAIKELPPFEFTFFDPDEKNYRTLSSSPVPLTVSPTAATPQPTVLSGTSTPAADNQVQPKEIVHIKPQLGTLHTIATPLIQRPVFLGLQALAPIIWVGSIFIRRRKERIANNPKLKRQRQMEGIVREGLPQLKQQAAANQSEEFFATTFRLLQEQLGERLDLPASAITEAVIDERLQGSAIKPETVDLLHELFRACNQARYAAQRTSQQLASYIPKIETALRELQEWNA